MSAYLKSIFVCLFCYVTLPLSAQEQITLDEIQALFMPDDQTSKLIHFNGSWADMKSGNLIHTINHIHTIKRENLEIYTIISHRNNQERESFLKMYAVYKFDFTYYEADYEEASYYFMGNKAESYMIDHALQCSWTFDEDPKKHKEQLLEFAIKQPKSNFTKTQNDIFAEELDKIVSSLMNASMRGEKLQTVLLAYANTKGGVRYLSADTQKLLFKASRANYIRNMTEEHFTELIRLSFLQMEELMKNEGMKQTDFPHTALALQNAKKHVKKEKQAEEDIVAVEGTISPVEYVKPKPRKAIEQKTFKGKTYELKQSHRMKISADNVPIAMDTDTPIKQGELIEIEATGSIAFGAFGEGASPDGFGNNVLKAYNKVPWMNHGALFGGIISEEEKERNARTDYEVILFGSQKLFVASESGYLILNLNARDSKNRRGHFEVKVKRYTKVN